MIQSHWEKQDGDSPDLVPSDAEKERFLMDLTPDNSLEGVRKKFLDNLTDEELVVFHRMGYGTYGLNPRESVVDPKKVRKFLEKRAQADLLIKIAHGIVHEVNRPPPEMSFAEIKNDVFNSLPILKEKLSLEKRNTQGEVTKSFLTPETRPFSDKEKEVPLIPIETIVLFHPEIPGEIHITNHAFERFLQYRSGVKETFRGLIPAALVRKLRKTFATTKVDDTVSSGHRVERIINNNFQRAFYLIDPGRQFRFVVLEKELNVVTVERPR